MSSFLPIEIAAARTMVFAPPLTDAEFERLCAANDLIHFERTREGKILIQAPAGGFTSRANLRICSHLYNWWMTHRQGDVYDSSAGFFLFDGSVLSPDASYVLPEKLKGLTKDDLTGFPRLCPDFVIELLSATDSVPAAKEKMERWIENGASLGWLIDPYHRQVHVYEPGVMASIESGGDIRGKGPVDGFVLDLEEIWRCYEI